MSLIKSNGGGLGGSGSPGGSLGSFYSHTINQSLRLDDASGAYLTIASASPTATDRKKVTVSCWVKRSQITGSGVCTIFHGAGNGLMMQFLGGSNVDRLYLYESPWQIISDRLFRDAGAWMHIALILDSTQSTDSNRSKLYINGELQDLSSWTVGSGANRYPALNYSFTWHTGTTMRIGSVGDTSDLGGYLAEFISIDGQDTSISDFGETKDGVWVPKDVSGLTLGNAGFYLPFSQDRTVSASAFFDEDDNSYVAWTDPGNEYEIGASDDYTLELFFWPTATEVSSSSYIAGYYRTTSPAGYFAIETSLSSRNFYLYYSNGASYTFGTFASGAVDAGRWHHLAFNRSSGTLRCFLDGAEVGSAQTSNTRTHDIPEFRVNKAHATSNVTFDGYISNVRLVIGSAVYSDGSSITVPTSPLTAVTNTKILACTTTTITADASSNNVTGTANGTAGSGYYATDGISPFPNSAFNEDAGSNGIDFSANNILDPDVVPDSPTNNFSTWNPLINTGQTRVFKDGNTNLFSSAQTWSNNQWNQGTIGVTGGTSDTKFYFEFVANVGGSGYIIGVGRAASKATGYTTYDGAVFLYNTATYSDNSATVTGLSSASALDVIRIAFDASNGKVWIGNASGWFNSGNPAGGANEVGTISSYEGEILVPILNRPDLTNGYMVLNFGQDDTFAGSKPSGSAAAQDGNGIGKFYLTPPSGFLALCTSNLPNPSIGPGASTQSDDYFNTVLYTGNGNTGQTISGVGFQPNWTWLKNRSTSGGYQHILHDSVRGAGNSLRSNSSAVEADRSAIFTAFTSDGFTLGSGQGDTWENLNSGTYVAWNWKAGTAFSNSAGANGASIASSGSVNTTAGFAIISYTGTSTVSESFAHGLSQAPELVITKARNTTDDWRVHGSVLGTNKFLSLSGTGAVGTDSSNGGFPDNTDTLVNLGYESTDGTNYIAYCFHSVDGYSKVGSYVGNGSTADGTFVFTGFRPAWVVVKQTNTTSNWQIWDATRNEFNVTNRYLRPNTSDAEVAGTGNSAGIDILSNGWKFKSNASAWNQNGGTYIYLAFAEQPFKFSLAR